jgi:hemerythrin-like domain-containing protein
VRIERAAPIAESDLAAWQAEIAQHFRAEIGIHFAAEEQFVFPAAQAFPELNLLVEKLISEHAWLRERSAKAEAQGMSGGEIAEFAQGLSAHIRKEERLLFERLQELMSEGELAGMGHKLEDALKEAGQSCILPAKNVRGI